MKIEFCCEEMMREMERQESFGIYPAWDYHGKPKPTIKTHRWATTHGTQPEIKLCPYCGAKIEITAKDDKS